MKKILSVILLSLLFITNISAESCSVVSGTGKKIGDEIACGTEHFYVIESNNNETKMLSKYNLYVGANYNKIKVDPSIYIYSKCNDSSCSESGFGYSLYYFDGAQVVGENTYDKWINKLKDKYNLNYVTDINSARYEGGENSTALILYVPDYENITVIDGDTYIKENIKLYPYTLINNQTDGFNIQNELALGVTGEKGNANYPIYATLALFPGYYGYSDNNETAYDVSINYDNFENGYTNFDFKDNTSVKYYLNNYKELLNNKGYEISNVDMINIKEINDLVKSVTSKELPLSDWFNASININAQHDNEGYYYNLGDLKQYLTDDYKWLWGTSYWTKTFAANIEETAPNSTLVYFVSSSGDICFTESECSRSIPRAGLRPVVTIENENLIYPYNIDSKTDGNGSIEVVKTAYANDKITFRVSPKPGFTLSKLKLTDIGGFSVTYSQQQIITNNDGTVSVNTFTMPSADVLIEATFEKSIINPKTGVTLPISFMLIVLLIGSITMIYSDNKIQKLN